MRPSSIQISAWKDWSSFTILPPLIRSLSLCRDKDEKKREIREERILRISAIQYQDRFSLATSTVKYQPEKDSMYKDVPMPYLGLDSASLVLSSFIMSLFFHSEDTNNVSFTHSRLQRDGHVFNSFPMQKHHTEICYGPPLKSACPAKQPIFVGTFLINIK